MTVLIDSDVIIDGLKSVPSALRALDLLAPAGLAISAVTLGEVLDGILLVSHQPRRRRELESFIAPMEVIAANRDVMERFADIRSGLRVRGLLIPDFDLVIAATAVERGYPLVTRNLRHFTRIPELVVVSPEDVIASRPPE